MVYFVYTRDTSELVDVTVSIETLNQYSPKDFEVVIF
jgi:hypothetical protein